MVGWIKKSQMESPETKRGDLLVVMVECLVEEALGEHRRAGGDGEVVGLIAVEMESTTTVAWKTRRRFR
jgi:hypothetical protein